MLEMFKYGSFEISKLPVAVDELNSLHQVLDRSYGLSQIDIVSGIFYVVCQFIEMKVMLHSHSKAT